MITIKQVPTDRQSADSVLSDDYYMCSILVPETRNTKGYDSGELAPLFSNYGYACDYFANDEDLARHIYKLGTEEHGAHNISFEDYFKCLQDETLQNACIFFNFVMGGNWQVKTIRGCCQGDWAEILYDADMISIATLNDFETAYFNLGTEWYISDENDDGFYYYSTEWDEHERLAELEEQAYAYFGDSDVEIYRFTGWTRTAQYERM